MKTMQKRAMSAMAAAVLLGLGACSGMSTQDKDTAIGAGAGAVIGGAAGNPAAGALIGGAAGAVGGAATSSRDIDLGKPVWR